MFTRMYKCEDCGHEWKHWHISKNEPAPNCELGCDTSAIVDDAAESGRGKMAEILEAQQAPARGGSTRAKAVEMTYKTMEEAGYTDMRDNLREGDNVVVGPAPIQTAEAEKITRELVQAGASPEAGQQIKQGMQGFWQHEKAPAPQRTAPMPGAGPGAQLMHAAQTAPLAVAAGGAAAARADGVDPVAMLHKAGKEGSLGKTYNVVAK